MIEFTGTIRKMGGPNGASRYVVIPFKLVLANSLRQGDVVKVQLELMREVEHGPTNADLLL